MYVDCIRGRQRIILERRKCYVHGPSPGFGCHCFFQLGLVTVLGLNCVIGKHSDYIAGEEQARAIVKVKFTQRGMKGIAVLFL